VGRTPQAITNLPAGTVSVTVSREGYETWQKNILVIPGRTTELRDIRLWPSSPSRQVLIQEASMFSLSPSRQLLAVLTNQNSFTLLDQEGLPASNSLSLTSRPESLLWAPNNSSILIRASTGSYQLVTVGQRLSTKTLPRLAQASEVVWDPRVPNRLLYRNQAGSIAAHHTITGSTEILVAKVETFALSSRQIYAVLTDGTVASFTLQGELVNRAIPAPTGVIESLAVTPAGRVVFELADQSFWFLADEGNVEKIIDQAQSVAWSPDGRMLLIQTDTHTLYVFNVDDERATTPLKELQLVIRLARDINAPQWYAGGHHLIYQVGDEILITEIDTRDQPRTYQLDTTNLGQAQPTVGEDGEVVFYLKSDTSTTSLIASSVTISQ
ncbi:PEGA domain-containing protein, partial [Patescibacteria group bacterium]|nr:PEGA domain-containing protein [Patescibacteria group bacterium]